MPLNKDIIIRVVLGLILFLMFAKVVVPVLFEMLKRKIPGSYDPDHDIDSMIRRQKEKLRSQYGITSREEAPVSDQASAQTSTAPTQEIERLYKETRWGGGEFAKSIQSEIARHYSYTLAETKISAFVLLAEKRNYIRHLNLNHQKSQDAIKNYLSLAMLFLILVEEIRSKDHSLLEKVASKCHVTADQFMLALQLKILFAIKSKKEIKEERLFADAAILHQYSEETIRESIDIILAKEANLWARGPSLFFEELSLYLTYADILLPVPKVQNKKDLQTAYHILNATPEMKLEDIKKAYKKIAMARHPDKIGQMQLPKVLEKKAISQFNHIQEAYEIINTHRKK